jgi:hypothetical protein
MEGKNSYRGYPTEFAGSTHNPKKIIRAPNLPIRTKISPKKASTLKRRGAKNSYESYPTKFAG